MQEEHEHEEHLQDRDLELRTLLERLWQDLAAAGYVIGECDGLDVISIVLESLGEFITDREHYDQHLS